ncbi:MAG: hypothetical protein C5B54_12350, partial [Acidobacteria bacterium]
MALTLSFVAPNHERFTEAWQQRLEILNPECSLEHLQVLMTCEPHKEHYFVLGVNQRNDVVAIAYLVIQTVRFLGCNFRVLTLGGSIGADALWIDRTSEEYVDVVRELLRFSKKHIPHSIVVLKPFDYSRDLDCLKANEKELNFINVYGTTQADLNLSGLETYDDYLAKLEKKKRYYLKKVDKDADRAGLMIEVTTDFADAVPALYPLFKSVSDRASEVKDLDPLSIQYLECLAQLRALNTQAILVRAHDRLVG